MAKMLSKVKEILGFDGYDEDDIDELEENEEVFEEEEEGYSNVLAPISRRTNNNKVVNIQNIHTNNSPKLMITKPVVYDDAMEICNALKNRKIIVINTSAWELRVAQRLLDFVSGASYAVGGDLQEVEKGVFIVAPSNVEVSNELKTELTSKGIFNWSK